MPSTLAQTATILAVGRQPSGKSRAFSALRPGGLRRDRFQSRWHWAEATRVIVVVLSSNDDPKFTTPFA